MIEINQELYEVASCMYATFRLMFKGTCLVDIGCDIGLSLRDWDCVSFCNIFWHCLEISPAYWGVMATDWSCVKWRGSSVAKKNQWVSCWQASNWNWGGRKERGEPCWGCLLHDKNSGRNHSSKSDYEDYKWERESSYLSSLVVVLWGLVEERKYLGFYAEDLTAGILDMHRTEITQSIPMIYQFTKNLL